jgi:hypothetical protein
VKHKFGIDTVRLDQSLNGSTWNRIGTYTFTGSTEEGVTISNAVTTAGKVIIADALRIISFDSTLVSVEEDLLALPASFKLEQNFPNPFNPTTIIRFDLPGEGLVKGVVYDILGREVVTLLNDEMSAGSHQMGFNAVGLPSGVYIFRLQSGKYSSSIKMILMK